MSFSSLPLSSLLLSLWFFLIDQCLQWMTPPQNMLEIEIQQLGPPFSCTKLREFDLTSSFPSPPSTERLSEPGALTTEPNTSGIDIHPKFPLCSAIPQATRDLAESSTSTTTYTATSALLNKTLDPDTYLRGISDEADRRALKTRTKEAKEIAFNANASSSKSGRKGKGKKSNVEYCWAKGGGGEGQGPKQKGKGKATANTAADSDDDSIWTSTYGSESEEDDSKWFEMAEQNIAEYLAAEYSRGEENSRLEGPKVEHADEEIAWLTDDGEISLDEIESSKSDAEMDDSLPNCSPHKIDTESDYDSMPDLDFNGIREVDGERR
ncbi:uncharacterized protein BT62DRAFT_917543 [Guyanagaster necrorhizus]|uniref:Uncharacterized protein n=1 Tax=Guyanagaster necrorhizus TaxID=856835 RepID=A0A9P7W0L8_9AGAR|nr:uncharacterized protein BT62DRAFT_917543 [Guyanagaster necrorhizus MCA 3950]KAG7449997.1 hypothetical protein BT62DRAFT_917543 [Guyanagaster necrorhizus MCA 3950]